MRSKPKVAFLRGYFMPRSETDYMVHVGTEFDLHVFSSRHGRFNLTEAPLEVKRLPALEDAYDLMPAKLARFAQAGIGKGLGLDGVFFGLGSTLAGFDLVHTAESLFYFSAQAARLKRRLGYKLVVLQDEVYPFQREASPVARRVRRQVHAAADMFAARTERARDALLLEGVAEERIAVVPHGVDTAMFRPLAPDPAWRARAGAGAGSDDRVALFIGRLTFEKGVITLLHALKLAQTSATRNGAQLRLLIVGSGVERQTLERLAQRLGLAASITFIANVPFADVPALISACDMFVLPSIASRRVSEQFGHVLLQAMACERAVVCTDCGPMTEVVGDSAWLVPQNDPHSLAEALASLAADPARRADLAARGLQRVRALFTAEGVARQVMDLYWRTLNAAKPNPGEETAGSD